MKVQGLIMLSGLPQFAEGDKDGPIVNQRAIFRRAAEVLSGDDAALYTLQPQPAAQGAPPPDPKVVAAQIKDGTTKAQVAGQIQEKQIDHAGKLAEIHAEAEQREADRDAANMRAQLQFKGTQVKAGAGLVDSHLDRQHEAGLAGQQQAHEASMSDADRALQHVHHATDTQTERQKLAASLMAPTPETGGNPET
jgi:hypothetical protein